MEERLTATTAAKTTAASISAAVGRSASGTTTTYSASVTSSGSTTSAATTATSSSTTATKARTLTGNILQESRNFLVSLLEKFDQISNNASVAAVEECSRQTSIASTTSTTNAMDVIIDVGWKIVVDDVGNVRDVQSPWINTKNVVSRYS